MSRKHRGPMSLAEITETKDENIDFSDISELDERFWAAAKRVDPDRTQSVTLRVKTSVLDAFKAKGRGYQTRMNAVLESYVRTMEKQR